MFDKESNPVYHKENKKKGLYMYFKSLVFSTILLGAFGGAIAQTMPEDMPPIAPSIDPSLFDSLPQKKAISTHESISFDGRFYIFGFGDIKENQYFTIGDTPVAWSSLIAVHDFPNFNDPLLAAQNMYNKLIGDGKTANLVIHRFSKEPILTFFLEKPDSWELNIWRFYPNKTQTAVTALQFAKGFKIPQTDTDKQELKESVKNLTAQFLNLPKQRFVY